MRLANREQGVSPAREGNATWQLHPSTTTEARVAALSRDRSPDGPELEAARRDLRGGTDRAPRPRRPRAGRR